jgi:hypothetical protein
VVVRVRMWTYRDGPAGACRRTGLCRMRQSVPRRCTLEPVDRYKHPRQPSRVRSSKWHGRTVARTVLCQRSSRSPFDSTTGKYTTVPPDGRHRSGEVQGEVECMGGWRGAMTDCEHE